MERFSNTPSLNNWRQRSSSLCRWFEIHRRDLPWRRVRSPYFTLVSELMLQQTTVKTVVPKFELFVRRFPTIQDLAAASVEEVLQAWEGLGYYRRARFLHACAQQVRETFAGNLPRTVEQLMTLKGVGRYTAGAVASLAFGMPAPLVDGNVIRVFSRLFGWAHRDERVYYAQAEEWISESAAPGIHNEALMELGALVCTPETPRCERCPLASHCVAFQNQTVAQYPPPVERIKPRPTARLALIIRSGEQLLLGRVRAGQLCEGQWGPWFSLPLEEEDTSYVEQTLTSLSEAGWEPQYVCDRGHFTHTVYNERMKITVVTVDVLPQKFPKRLTSPNHSRWAISECQWASMQRLPRPYSSVMRKSLRLLQLQ